MQRKIKVLEILEATVGGTRTHLNQLVFGLDKSIFEVSAIVSLRRDTDFIKDIKEMEKNGINVFILPIRRNIHLLSDLYCLVKIYLLMIKYKYDIVHTHSSKAGILGRIAAGLARVENIFYTPHAFAFMGASTFYKKQFLVSSERYLAKYTDIIICVSKGEKSLALKQNIINRERLMTIENGVYIENLKNIDSQATKRELGIPQEHFVVGTVGDLRPQKDYSTFILSAKKVIDSISNVSFIIIGDGKQKKIIRQKIKKYGLEKNVYLLGKVLSPQKYYEMMDVYVLTSLWEGMPYSILEAMAVAKPVVATKVPGSKDLVVHNQTGFLVTARSIDQIYRSIIYLLKDPQIRLVMGRKGRKLVKKKYFIDDQVSKIQRLYLKECRDSSKPDTKLGIFS